MQKANTLMNQISGIDSFIDFHKHVEVYLEGRVPPIFRGVKDEDYDLISKFGRLAKDELLDLPIALDYERRLLAKFRREALPHLDSIPRTELEWMAIAQHHGLPTRLLDWTLNPLVALYFAVEKDFDGNGAVYVLSDTTAFSADLSEPLKVDEVLRITPPHVTKRIIAQSGRFTIHPNPLEIYDTSKVTKLQITASAREELRRVLYRYGIHRFSLFPDLDNLTLQMDWESRGRFESDNVRTLKRYFERLEKADGF